MTLTANSATNRLQLWADVPEMCDKKTKKNLGTKTIETSYDKAHTPTVIVKCFTTQVAAQDY